MKRPKFLLYFMFISFTFILLPGASHAQVLWKALNFTVTESNDQNILENKVFSADMFYPKNFPAGEKIPMVIIYPSNDSSIKRTGSVDIVNGEKIIVTAAPDVLAKRISAFADFAAEGRKFAEEGFIAVVVDYQDNVELLTGQAGAAPYLQKRGTASFNAAKNQTAVPVNTNRISIAGGSMGALIGMMVVESHEVEKFASACGFFSVPSVQYTKLNYTPPWTSFLLTTTDRDAFKTAMNSFDVQIKNLGRVSDTYTQVMKPGDNDNNPHWPRSPELWSKMRDFIVADGLGDPYAGLVWKPIEFKVVEDSVEKVFSADLYYDPSFKTSKARPVVMIFPGQGDSVKVTVFNPPNANVKRDEDEWRRKRNNWAVQPFEAMKIARSGVVTVAVDYQDDTSLQEGDYSKLEQMFKGRVKAVYDAVMDQKFVKVDRDDVSLTGGSLGGWASMLLAQQVPTTRYASICGFLMPETPNKNIYDNMDKTTTSKFLFATSSKDPFFSGVSIFDAKVTELGRESTIFRQDFLGHTSLSEYLWKDVRNFMMKDRNVKSDDNNNGCSAVYAPTALLLLVPLLARKKR